jgi:hypothetical protein
MKKILGLALLALSLAPLPSQAQKAKQHPSCKGSGVNIECPADLFGSMSRQSGTLVCSYDKRLRIWQLMQGQKPATASKTMGEIESPRDAASGLATGREVLYTSQTSEECETAGKALASQLSQNGNGFKWDTKTTEIKN